MEHNQPKAYAEYLKIVNDREYKKSLGLVRVQDVWKYLGVSQGTYYKYNIKRQKGQSELSIEEKEYADFLKKIKKHGTDGKGSTYARLWAELEGKLDKANKGEDKNEPSPSDYIAIAREVVRSLQREFREGNGSCVVCGFHQTLRNASCLDSERKHAADSEVEALAVPSRPD